MIIPLRQPYKSRQGVPIINRIDDELFKRSYFTYCMTCNFCNDICCSYGVDVDIENVNRLYSVASKLEQFTGTSRDDWFTGEFKNDPESPGGSYTRTKVIDGRCVFINKKGRGCLIHTFCVAQGLDYHDLKPIMSSLFPLTFDEGLLHPSNEIQDNSLVCIDTGPTLYRGVREDLIYYFGDECVKELDELERSCCAVSDPATPV